MDEMNLKVKGMMCGGCENRVKNALAEIDGIKSVDANHHTGIVKIISNGNISKETIEDTIKDIGFEVVKED